MRLKSSISWPYRTSMIPYFLTNIKEKCKADFTTYRIPHIPRVGTGAVWMRCGGACPVLVISSTQSFTARCWFPHRKVQQNTNDSQNQPITYEDYRIISLNVNDINIHERKDNQRQERDTYPAHKPLPMSLAYIRNQWCYPD